MLAVGRGVPVLFAVKARLWVCDIADLRSIGLCSIGLGVFVMAISRFAVPLGPYETTALIW